MRRHVPRALVASLVLFAAVLALPVFAEVESDPDLPGFAHGTVDKTWYLQARAAYFDQRLGVHDWTSGENPRVAAIRQMFHTQSLQGPISSGLWTPLGPAPIPNGQTTTTATAVSGRITAIAVNPNDANIVYVGAAQGGVYRTLDGGATWTPIFDAAASLSIGALALAPSDPTILYVGTGEANLSGDSFFGVGLYRIDAADTAPVLNGPFNPTPTNDVIGAKTFTGRAISKILVDPTDPAVIFVSTASGIGGLGGDAFAPSPPVTGLRGIYRSRNATSAAPDFTKLTVTSAGSIAPDVTGNRIVNDMVYDPSDVTNNTIVCWVFGLVAGEGGVYRTTDALSASPTFTQTFATTVVSSRGQLAAAKVLGITTLMVATGEAATGTSCTTGSGCLRKSTDGGATWGAKLAGGGGFCGGQCFYDLPIAIKPDNASVVLIGGSGNSTCSRVFARSTNGGTSFTAAGGADVGLHADAHAIVFAPSNTNTVYIGNDGGIFKSTNAGVSWTSLNNSSLSATQFQSVAVHPIDRWFTIGGTQDNGTPFFRPDQTWTRCDFGDGGNALIDQNAVDNSNVTMYHTYFNQQNNLVGYARVTSVANAVDNGWTFLGNDANGIAKSDNVQFYAPMALGPGNPNTVYYGTQRLYRSDDKGTTNVTVSQNPVSAGGVLSAIGISPLDDNVRIVGTTDGQVWMTQSGSSTLTNVTSGSFPFSSTGTRYVSRALIDPNDTNTAWVCFGGFGMPAGQHIWKTNNLAGGAGTWVASGNGIPDVPVDAFAIDAAKPLEMYAGTDIGVYKTTDGGANWFPFNTGMPVVAVFDMAIQQTNRTMRIATHGRGMWERLLDAGPAAVASLVRSEVIGGHVLLSWHTDQQPGATTRLYRRYVPGNWQLMTTLTVDGEGGVSYDDGTAHANAVYDYRLGLLEGGAETFAGAIRVDVAAANRLTLVGANPTISGMRVAFMLPEPSPARIDVVDVTGRRVYTREVGSMGAGRHEIDLHQERFTPGIYWVRLVQGERMSSAKIAVLGSGE